MADFDFKRLLALEHTKGTQQYGETLDVTAAQVGATSVQALATKTLCEVRGEKYDLRAWRIYLSPWVAKPDMNPAPPAPVSAYALSGVGPNNPIQSPGTLDNFIGTLYARVQFGAGGYQHTALVDWPPRGCVIGVSGSYVSVAASGFVNLAGAQNSSELPKVGATMGPDPGGGDSSRPATFTYPIQLRGNADVGLARWVFSVPPFARSFTPLLDLVTLDKAAGFNELRIAVQNFPSDIVTGGNNLQSWIYTKAAGVPLQGIDWPLEPFPLGGQGTALTAIGPIPTGADVVVEIDDANTGHFVGMMFDLDL